MDLLRVLLSLILFLLVPWLNPGTFGIMQDADMNYVTHSQTTALPSKRRYGAIVDGLSVIIGIGGMIMGITCTEVECPPDQISPKMTELFLKVESIENQITSLQSEVAEILHSTHVKWYLDLIKIVNSKMGVVANETLKNSTNQQDVAMRQKFVDQNLGINRDDYVYKALFFIPTLITDDKVVEHYLKYQRRKVVEDDGAISRTCEFAKEVINYQDNGYMALILAYSIAFKGDESAYYDALAETCAVWRSATSLDYKKKCEEMESQFRIPEGYEDRRQRQKDYIHKIKGLENCSLEGSTPSESASDAM